MDTEWRVPVDESYAARLGRATYVFAYYEWIIIHILDRLSPGFLQEYSRGGKPMVSGLVAGRLAKAIGDLASSIGDVTPQELKGMHGLFSSLTKERNALIHAHPATDDDGSQILAHQKSGPNALPDMKWPLENIERVIGWFDEAAVAASDVLHRLMKAGPL